jgi:hypothetical protein
MPPTMIYQDSTMQVAADGTLCVARWTDAPQISQFSALASALRTTAREGAALQLLNVVDRVENVPGLSSERRRAAEQLLNELALSCSSVAHVVLIPGMRGAAVRMVLSTLLMLLPGKVGRSIHANIRDGAAALVSVPGAPDHRSTAQFEALYAWVVRETERTRKGSPTS